MYTQVARPDLIRIGTRVRVHIPNHRHNLQTGVVEEVTTLDGYQLRPIDYKGSSVVKIRFDQPTADERIFRFYLRTLEPLNVRTTHEVW